MDLLNHLLNLPIGLNSYLGIYLDFLIDFLEGVLDRFPHVFEGLLGSLFFPFKGLLELGELLVYLLVLLIESLVELVIVFLEDLGEGLEFLLPLGVELLNETPALLNCLPGIGLMLLVYVIQLSVEFIIDLVSLLIELLQG